MKTACCTADILFCKKFILTINETYKNDIRMKHMLLNFVLDLEFEILENLMGIPIFYYI